MTQEKDSFTIDHSSRRVRLIFTRLERALQLLWQVERDIDSEPGGSHEGFREFAAVSCDGWKRYRSELSFLRCEAGELVFGVTLARAMGDISRCRRMLIRAVAKFEQARGKNKSGG